MSASEVAHGRPTHAHYHHVDASTSPASASESSSALESALDSANDSLSALSQLVSTSGSGEVQDLFSQLRSALQSAFESFSSLVKQTSATHGSSQSPAHCPTNKCHSSGVPEAGTSGASETTPTPPRVTLTFSERAKQTLETDKDGKVSEAELRRGVVSYALYFKDPALGETFDEVYANAIDSGSTPSSALERSLVNLIESGAFPREDANWLYSLSRRAANFSETQANTIDESGGIARDAAVQFAEASLAGIQSGAVKVDRISL